MASCRNSVTTPSACSLLQVSSSCIAVRTHAVRKASAGEGSQCTACMRGCCHGRVQRETNGRGIVPTFSHLYIAFRMYSLDLRVGGRGGAQLVGLGGVDIWDPSWATPYGAFGFRAAHS